MNNIVFAVSGIYQAINEQNESSAKKALRLHLGSDIVFTVMRQTGSEASADCWQSICMAAWSAYWSGSITTEVHLALTIGINLRWTAGWKNILQADMTHRGRQLPGTGKSLLRKN